MGEKNSLILPQHSCDKALAGQFCSFFGRKITVVREELDRAAQQSQGAVPAVVSGDENGSKSNLCLHPRMR